MPVDWGQNDQVVSWGNEDKPAEAPAGAAALSKTEAITETPWYAKRVPLTQLLALGLKTPEWATSDMGLSVQDVLDALPAMGGAVGGAIGGASAAPTGGVAVPLTATGGSVLGGAAGESARQLGMRAIGAHAPATSLEAAKKIGTEGLIQGAAELGGRGIAAGANALGRGMVEQSVRPTITLQGEFPNVMETIVKERLPVGNSLIPGGKKGSELALDRLAEESASVRRLLQRATAGGKTFEASKLAAPVRKTLAEFAETEAHNPGRVKQLEALLDNFLESKKGPLSPLDVQRLKQATQKIAKPIYKAVARGENVGTEQGVMAQFNSALATGAKQAMETIPGVAEGEAKKKALIGASKAIRRAEERRLSLMAESASGVAGALGGVLSPGSGLDDRTRNAVLAWAVTRGVLHPRQLSRAGLALTSEQAKLILTQFPRLAEMFLEQGSNDQSE